MLFQIMGFDLQDLLALTFKHHIVLIFYNMHVISVVKK